MNHVKICRATAAGVFAYESAAICSGGKLPTITRMVNGNPWLASIPAGALFAHFLIQNPRGYRAAPAPAKR
jgi:hypothetical protein